MSDSSSENEWSEWWDARVAAIEAVLGKVDEMIGHAPIPFDFGADIGGAADIIRFKNHLKGIVSVTSELIGRNDQIQNENGNYELMICRRDDEEWGERLISRLAHYTLEAKLSHRDTMDIGGLAPGGSTLAALMFFNYASFQVRGRDSGLLLCMGITAEELQACHDGRREQVENALKESKVYPFTDLYRKSVDLK